MMWEHTHRETTRRQGQFYNLRIWEGTSNIWKKNAGSVSYEDEKIKNGVLFQTNFSVSCVVNLHKNNKQATVWFICRLTYKYK
jgi:hypothetical protein